jgi:hypothetical protein
MSPMTTTLGRVKHRPGAPASVVVESSAEPLAWATGAADDLPLDLKEPDWADRLGDDPDPEQADDWPAAGAVLDNQTIYRIVREVAVDHSGDALYSAVAADREYGLPTHPAYGRRHFGLGFGLVLFPQASGHLGSVLTLMRQRDPVGFAEVFGPDAEALVATTMAATEEERLAPVGGKPLWSETWIARFRRAGESPAFQAAQNEEAIERQFRPMLPVAGGLGLTSDRALAMAYDQVVSRGLGGGLRWLVHAAGPLRTAAQRAHALRLLGVTDLATFQASQGLAGDGRFGPETHAALVRELRRQGEATLPGPAELACRLSAAASGPVRRRLRRLQASLAFTDVAYDTD